jgi:hypothetical protein
MSARPLRGCCLQTRKFLLHMYLVGIKFILLSEAPLSLCTNELFFKYKFFFTFNINDYLIINLLI